MGFCLFSIVAITACYTQQVHSLKKVTVYFWGTSDVLAIMQHRSSQSTILSAMWFCQVNNVAFIACYAQQEHGPMV